MSEKTWHHLVREDGSACLYYTLSGVAAHFVVFDTLDPIPEQRIKDLESAISASQAREARLREALSDMIGIAWQFKDYNKEVSFMGDVPERIEQARAALRDTQGVG